MNSVLARISHQRPAVDEAKGPASMARGNSSRTSPGVRVCRQTGRDESRPYTSDGGHSLPPRLPSAEEGLYEWPGQGGG